MNTPTPELLSETAWRRQHRRKLITGARAAEWISGRYSEWAVYPIDQTEPVTPKKADRSVAAKRAAETRKLNREAKKRAAARAERLALVLDSHAPTRLHDLALECLHAQNRRAKHLTGSVRHEDYGEIDYTAKRKERDAIYELKDRYLTALLTWGRGMLYTFEVTQSVISGWHCNRCDREWGGFRNDTCYSCGLDAEPDGYAEVRRWYLYQHESYRFHMPRVKSEFEARAIPIEPHQPTQSPREVPTVKLAEIALTNSEQVAIIERACVELERQS